MEGGRGGREGGGGEGERGDVHVHNVSYPCKLDIFLHFFSQVHLVEPVRLSVVVIMAKPPKFACIPSQAATALGWRDRTEGWRRERGRGRRGGEERGKVEEGEIMDNGDTKSVIQVERRG